MDPDIARSTLGISPRARLTHKRIDAAFEAASESIAGSEAASDATTRADRSRLEEARQLLRVRANRLPPLGEALGRLGALQFFVGGFVLFTTALGVMVGWATWYDGMLSLIGWSISAVFIAVVTMLIAWMFGLPLRHEPRLRARWLANGEFTLAGVLLGFLALQVVFAVAPITTVVDELGEYEARDVNGWALLLAWSLFSFSVVHFVWPLRWLRRE